MRQRGCVLAAIGAVLLLGSLGVGLLWLVFPWAGEAHDTFGFGPEKTLRNVPVSLREGDRYRARIVLAVVLDGRDERDAEPAGALLRFPLRYRIAREGGRPLAWQDTFVRWPARREAQTRRTPAEGGRLVLAEDLNSFRAPEGGKVVVSAEVDRDVVRGAEVAEAELSLHGPSAWARCMPLAIGAFCLGPTILFIGVVVFLCSLSAGDRRQGGEG